MVDELSMQTYNVFKESIREGESWNIFFKCFFNQTNKKSQCQE